MLSTSIKTPDATLLIAPGCPHCPAVVQALTDLVKSGNIGSLMITNIAIHPEAAEKAGTRSVPWTRIGQFELVGAQTPQELRAVVDKASNEDPVEHLAHLLETSELDLAIEQLRKTPEALPSLVAMLDDLDTPMAVRIGIGAALEDLDEVVLKPAEEILIKLTGSIHQAVRADAAHYLSLFPGEKSRTALQSLLEDQSNEVREIAIESLEELGL